MKNEILFTFLDDNLCI